MSDNGSDGTSPSSTSSSSSSPVPDQPGQMEGSSGGESSSTTGTYFAISGAIILKVYLDATASRVTEVPITPQTTVGDVLQCCKEPGEEHCHLAELWRGCERPVPDEEKPYEILQQWGIHRDEVRFFIRHEPAAPTVNDGGRMRRAATKNGMMAPGHQENGSLPHGVDLTLSELQDMAARQQQQIEAQQQLLVAKEQRLRFLKQQELRHEQIAAENERLRKLREKVEAQELKLKKLRALRGQVSENKGNNNNLTAELEMIKGLFNEKEKELAMAVSKVEELTHQLEEIRSGRMNGLNSGDNRNNSPGYLELEKLRKELMMRNKLNEAQNSKLAAHREIMHERKEELSKMDIRIAELQQRLKKNRSIQYQQQQQQQQQPQPPSGFINQRGGSLNAKIGNRPVSANIAAVEPYIKHGSNKDSMDQHGYTISKHDPKYQTLPPNIKLLGPDGKRLDGEPNGNGLMQNEYGRTDNGHMEKNNNLSGHDLKVDTNLVGPESSGPSSPGKSGKDLLPKETIHRVPDYKPSKGHTTAFEAMEAALKKSEKSEGSSTVTTRPPQTAYKPSSLSNFTARPFGSTYSTAMFANRSSLITTQPNQSSSPITTNTISSPGAYFPKTSTPIQGGGGGAHSNNQGDMKEIFITGAPSTSSSSIGRPPLYTTAQSGPTQYPPLTIATNHVPSQQPLDVSPRSSRGFLEGKSAGAPPPHYQIASSRPQEPMQPQLASDAPSPTSSNHYQQRPSPSLPPASPTRLHPNQTLITNSNKSVQSSSGNNFGVPSTSTNGGRQPPIPGQIAMTSSTKVTLSEHYVTNSSKDSSANSNHSQHYPGPGQTQTNSSSSSNIAHGAPQVLPKPSSPTEKEANKKDITSSSVSSALSVLMSGSTTTSTTATTTRPFRYAPKSVIANTYMRKLGSNTLEEYRRTMNQIYKDFQPPTIGGGDGSSSGNNSTSPEQPGFKHHPDQQNSEYPPSNEQESKLGPSSQGDFSQSSQKIAPPPPRNMHESQNGEQIQDQNAFYPNGPPPYRGAPAYDIETERIRYKPNAPKTLRRRLSSGESDDLARFNKQQQKPEGEDNFANVQQNSSNVVRVVDTQQDSYNNNFSGENQQQVQPPLAISYDMPHGDGDKIMPPNNISSGNSEPPKVKQESKPAVIRAKKTNLKAKGSVKSSRRVSFDPLALLLDASLEGELELVKRTAAEVADPSAANDEGITALHNAICAGHYDIVKFLAEFGCNVNAPDSDGWTPLHCAASCNNLAMVRLLVEHGACIFATTISDHETAAEKCEEDEDGYDGCSEYLYSIQEKLGIINKGVVYAVFDYNAQNPDELTFRDGVSLTVLRKGDDHERDWWWSRVGDREGYIPRNLLGLYPRVPLKSASDGSKTS